MKQYSGIVQLSPPESSCQLSWQMTIISLTKRVSNTAT